MQRVFKFLDMRTVPEVVEEICRKHSFAAEAKRQPGDEDRNALIRKGIVGDWKNYFSAACTSAFQEIAGEALRLAGYELMGGSQ
jgi:hypothetical protein